MKNEKHLWDKLENEPTRCFIYFNIYKDMGVSRTLKKVAKEVDVNVANISNQSTKYNWVKRVAAWEMYLQKAKDDSQLDIVKKMNDRMAQHAQALETTLMAYVQDFMKRLESGEINFSSKELTDKDRMYMLGMVADKLPKVTDVERKARGEATEITKSTVEQTTKVILPPGV